MCGSRIYKVKTPQVKKNRKKSLKSVIRIVVCWIRSFAKGVLIRFIVHTSSLADAGFPDIDPHRAGAQSTPYFAPFAGANHPPPTLCTSEGWSRYIGSREKLTPTDGEHAKQDLSTRSGCRRVTPYVPDHQPPLILLRLTNLSKLG